MNIEVHFVGFLYITDFCFVFGRYRFHSSVPASAVVTDALGSFPQPLHANVRPN